MKELEPNPVLLILSGPNTEYCLSWPCHLYLDLWELPNTSLLSGIPSILPQELNTELISIWGECTGPRKGPESQRVGDRGASFCFTF